MTFLSKISNFMELTRAYSLGMTFASFFIVLSYAVYDVNFSILKFLILLIAVCCLHMFTNLFDDYIDIKSKLKEGFSFEQMQFSTDRKARLIRNNTFSIKQVETILTTLLFIAFMIGAYFFFVAGWQVILFAILGGLLCVLYPISSKYFLAEINVGLVFGPILIMGSYFALTSKFNFQLFLLSWTIFFTTIILLHVHNIMDWEFDEKEGKNTLARLVKTKLNAILVLRWLIIISYLIVFFGILTLQFNPHTVYVFVTLIIATKLTESMHDYINIKDVKFEPRWYYGPFENWEKIKELKLDYFMYRFYLARNFSFFFALLAAIGTVG